MALYTGIGAIGHYLNSFAIHSNGHLYCEGKCDEYIGCKVALEDELTLELDNWTLNVSIGNRKLKTFTKPFELMKQNNTVLYPAVSFYGDGVLAQIVRFGTN